MKNILIALSDYFQACLVLVSMFVIGISVMFVSVFVMIGAAILMPITYLLQKGKNVLACTK